MSSSGSTLINDRSLMQPHWPGRNIEDERWKTAFGWCNKLDDVEATPDFDYNERVRLRLESKNK
jgi:hypothetical protein